MTSNERDYFLVAFSWKVYLFGRIFKRGFEGAETNLEISISRFMLTHPNLWLIAFPANPMGTSFFQGMASVTAVVVKSTSK